MTDYGTRQTDLAVRRAEWRLSRVYRQAQRDIDDKLKDWQKRHAAREEKYRQQLKDGKITQADFNAWMRGQVFQEKQWKARQEQIRQTLLNADREARRIINEGKIGVFAANANYIGYGLEHDSNINTGFTLYDRNTVARLIRSDPQILPKPAPGVVKDKAYIWYNKLMDSAITQGIIQGETIPQIARRIMSTTGERTYAAAVRNARTAYTGAQNAGRIEGLHQAQRLGIKVKKKWLATLDGRTRDSHRHLDGQIQEVDDPFISPLGKIRFPGDPTANGGDVYSCRCTLTYVYPEYPGEMQRRDNVTGEIVGDMTYREWEAMKQGREEAPEDLPEKREADRKQQRQQERERQPEQKREQPEQQQGQPSERQPEQRQEQPARTDEYLTNKQLEDKSRAWLEKETARMAAEWYKTGNTGISFPAGTDYDKVARDLAKGKSKTELMKDYKALRRRLRNG